MTNRLQTILLQKKREVDFLRAQIEQDCRHPIARLMADSGASCKSNRFLSSLSSPRLSIIAEIKRQSPSKGALAMIADPQALAVDYLSGGADAISVLTDKLFFGGSLTDLHQVAELLQDKPQAVLRKDFVIDPIQIAEAAIAGADAVLCIVAALQQRTGQILDAAKRMGIAVLVEVHNARELAIALDSGAEIIGVNNRDLTNFHIDTSVALQLIDKIPTNIIRVAESGILQPELAHTYAEAGYDAVLIGEALVRAKKPADFIRACHER